MAGKGVNRSIRLFINGKEVEHSVNNVRKTMNNLRKDINAATKGSEEYVRKSAELRKVTAYYQQMNEEITRLPSTIDKLSISTSKFLTIFSAFTSFSFLQQNVKKLIDLSAELADKQADVRKTTGMTKEEVRALTQELDKLDTRTSRSDLLSIAEEGGRIGIAKEEIADFVEAMNKANVALGDVFGSAEEVASTLGKLRFLYKETAEMGVSEAYNAIGSALNELGANGVASEQNIAAFATRVGALPNAFKPAIADAMALGAAFEESGVNAEVAGRSYGILVQAAANNTAAFAKQMNISREELEKMINDDPVEFFLKFTESFKGMDRNGVQMAKTLKSLGISADGVNKIIGAAANNNDRFRESIALSNQAMEEGTSLTDEYNVKNENLAASLDKIQKTFVEWIASDTVQDFVEGLVEWFGALIGAIDRTDEELNGWQKTLNFVTKSIGSLIVVMISYKTISLVLVNATKENIKQTLLYQGVIKGKTAVIKLAQIAMMAYGVVAKAVTGDMRGARYEAIWLGAALKALPWTAIISAVAGLISYLYIFNKETNKAVTAQQLLNEAHNEAAKEIASEKLQIEQLLKVSKDESIEKNKRLAALNELKKIMPEYANLLSLENINTKKVTEAVREYTKELSKNAKAKALQAKYDALESERLEIGNKTTKDYNSSVDNLFESIWDLFGIETKHYKSIDELESFFKKEFADLDQKSFDRILENAIKNSGLRNKEQSLKAIDELQKEIANELYKLNSDLKVQEEEYFEQNTPISDPKKEDPEVERRRRIAEELLKIEVAKNRRIRDEKLKNREEEIALMEEGFDKELALLETEKEKRLNKLADELEDLTLLREEYLRREQEERKKGNIAGANGFAAQAEELNKIVDIKNEELLITEKTFLTKRRQLGFEFDKKDFEEKQKAYDRELMNLETKHNNELKSISNFEKEKAKISKSEQQKTIDEIKLLLSEYGYSPEDLEKIKTFEKAKSEIILAQQKQTIEKQLEQLEAQQSKLKELINAEVIADAVGFGGSLTAKELDELILKYEELSNVISKLRNPEEDSELDANGRTADQANALGAVDILGTSAEEWEMIFQNLDTLGGKLAATKAIAQAMSQVWGSFFDAQNQKIKNDLTAYEAAANKKKTALAKQLEQGIISQETYNAKMGKLEADLERARTEAEYKQAVNSWKMNLMEATSNTALAVINALASGRYPLNLVFAAITGSLGAIQIGTIAKNKPKKPSGYFTGGETGGSGEYDAYGRELADGSLHAREYVIPEYLRSDPVIARMEEFIEARRRGMAPSVRLDRDGSPDGVVSPSSTPVPTSPDNAPDKVSIAILGALEKLNDNLEYLQENPLEAKLTRNLEVAKKLADDIEDYKKHRNKNRR